jgi:hypothetical protein
LVALHWTRHAPALRRGRFAYVQLGWLHRNEQEELLTELLQPRGVDTVEALVRQWYRLNAHRPGAEAVAVVAYDAATRRYALEVLDVSSLRPWVESVFYGEEPLTLRARWAAPELKEQATLRRTLGGQLRLAARAAIGGWSGGVRGLYRAGAAVLGALVPQEGSATLVLLTVFVVAVSGLSLMVFR